jgi:hypothetical protein
VRNALRRYVGRRVVVQVGDESIGGTLDSASEDVVLSQAALLDGSEPTLLDGVVVIPSGQVRWVQVA